MTSNTPQTTEKGLAVGLGEVLWDRFPDRDCFGGAPANFVGMMARLGAQACLVSRVGSDELGDRALQKLAENGVSATWVQRDGHHPTGTVDIQLSDDGVARYRFATDVAWDHLAWLPDLASVAARTQVVCFGTLGQRSPTAADTIQRFLSLTPPDCLRVFDINLRQDFYNDAVILRSLEAANLLKLNEDEWPVVQRVCRLSGSRSAAMASLREQFGLQVVALTEGQLGASLFTPAGEFSRPSPQVDVKDTVGAGDAFTAAMVSHMLLGHDWDRILEESLNLASYVCTQAGAVPPVQGTDHEPTSS